MLRAHYRCLPPALNVTEFAVCTGFSEEVIRRKLRANLHGLRRHATGRPWRIAPAALALFRVEPSAALTALQAAAQPAEQFELRRSA